MDLKSGKIFPVVDHLDLTCPKCKALERPVQLSDLELQYLVNYTKGQVLQDLLRELQSEQELR